MQPTETTPLKLIPAKHTQWRRVRAGVECFELDTSRVYALGEGKSRGSMLGDGYWHTQLKRVRAGVECFELDTSRVYVLGEGESRGCML